MLTFIMIILVMVSLFSLVVFKGFQAAGIIETKSQKQARWSQQYTYGKSYGYNAKRK
jgi:hypothetical protein